MRLTQSQLARLYIAVTAEVAGRLYAAKVHRQRPVATAHIAHEAGKLAVEQVQHADFDKWLAERYPHALPDAA